MDAKIIVFVGIPKFVAKKLYRIPYFITAIPPIIPNFIKISVLHLYCTLSVAHIKLAKGLKRTCKNSFFKLNLPTNNNFSAHNVATFK